MPPVTESPIIRVLILYAIKWGESMTVALLPSSLSRGDYVNSYLQVFDLKTNVILARKNGGRP